MNLKIRYLPVNQAWCLCFDNGQMVSVHVGANHYQFLFDNRKELDKILL